MELSNTDTVAGKGVIEAHGADAVVNVRFTTSSIADSGAAILAYGMAVRLR